MHQSFTTLWPIAQAVPSAENTLLSSFSLAQASWFFRPQLQDKTSPLTTYAREASPTKHPLRGTENPQECWGPTHQSGKESLQKQGWSHLLKLFPQCLEQRLMPSWCSASLLSIEQLNHSSRRYPGGPGVVLSPQGNVRKPGQRPEAR